MTIEELRHAVATSPDTHKFDRKRLIPTSTLISLCNGLVVVEEETKLVRLVRKCTTPSAEPALNYVFHCVDYTAKATLEKLLAGNSRTSIPFPPWCA